MKVVIIGGHLSPALSVIDLLSKTNEILFIGRRYTFEGEKTISLEYKTINALNIPFESISTGRLQRKFTKYTLFSLLKLPSGIFNSFRILKKFNPDVVVGFGGYVSIPVILAAFLLRIPIVIHEQTLEAGFANKFLSRFATKICLSFETSMKYFPKEKVVLTGNPIRQFNIQNLKFRIEDNKLPIIYITGGSSGAHFINLLIEGSIRELLERYNVIHQTGDSFEFNDFDRLEKIKAELPKELQNRYFIRKFVDPSEVGTIYKKSSIVISRGGMNTISELMYFEKPSILIPIPFSQNNEQLKNARFLEKLGIAKVLEQKGLDSEKLFYELTKMLQNIDNYKLNNKKSLKLFQNSAKNISNVINYEGFAKKKKIT